MMRRGSYRADGTMGHAATALILITALFAGGAAWAEAGLVAHYTFEEGPSGKVVKDWSGSGNHGKIVDNVSYAKLGEGKGYALRFNSGKAHVDCGNAPSLDLTDAVTLSVWFYPETVVQQGEGGVVGKVMGSYCMSYSGKCWAYMPGGSNYGSTTPVSLSAWHHVAATFDGKQVKTYVDGRLQGAQESKVKKLPHGENFYLRYPATYQTVTPEYKCMLDDVRVYNCALSEAEIGRLYREEAKAGGKHDATWFGKVRLTSHVFPRSSTVVVEANYAEMGVQAPGTVVKFEARNTADGKVMAQHQAPVRNTPSNQTGDGGAIRLEFRDLEKLGTHYWTLNVGDFPTGDYEVRAVMADKGGSQIGEPSSCSLKNPLQRPDWIKRYDGAKVLNNLVAELLNVPTAQAEAQKEHAFTNPRDGWIFISSTADPQGADSVSVFVDAETEPAITHEKGKGKSVQEAMRRLPAGRHTLSVRCEGAARPTALVVRAIPEMMVAGLGYTCGGGWPNVPILPCFGRYNMEYLKRTGILDNLNVLVERNAVPENAPYVEEWRRQGKKLIVRFGMWPVWQTEATEESILKAWTENRGLGDDGYDGIIADEFSGHGHGGVGKYPLYAAAIKRIAADPGFKGKVVYPYCMPMYQGDFAMDMLKAVVQVGYKWAEEKYLVEQPTEEAADAYMDLRLRQNALSYNTTFPGAARHMITTLGFMSAPPETLDVDPRVDFKVYMDKQMHLLANDPVFFGLYGIHWYHNGYVDEEDLRWSARLFRHYGIEGKKGRLTDDPYRLPHIENPDFDQGDAGWTLQPAEEGSISVAHAIGLGILQTRCRGGNEQAGDNFLMTRRSAKGPNRFSQTIKKLTPGRQYSVKMFTADYDEMKRANPPRPSTTSASG